MKLTFYGVRGSIPAPGAAFVRYGGNTACVHIALNDGTDIILDAGTGIKALGGKLVAQQNDIHLLLTHNHWDHIQGFPFFAPIYQAGRRIHIVPGKTQLNEQDAILQQMTGSYFPVHYQDLPAHITLTPVPDEKDSWQIGSATVSRMAMNHPGCGSSYLIDADGVRIAYITDNELYPPYQRATSFLDWVNFASGADLLIHDAQYQIQDMPRKAGWGHSVAEEAVKLAMACRAKSLALYSHDDMRTDDEIDQIQQHCRDIIDIGQMSVSVFAAAEGMCIDFDQR
ncbi:MBL fold metallo-hydrolase [Bowmanella sp. Y26]|uniref:MBL fold metallo-hydrolase n=1 Tax=Bowmanella yangjiangensis TaxID=2811230 RepID=A0ABS3CWH9_9ALTE|nr:MBL fold metallo-hydrolase [Bowmanella yangjiangensis]MBN7821448.1 MBL fold metallo-hydrolase [Bowmanella yangjiangensis]MBT1065691.1 MBL fold metallo-hydrolase [Bowmanella yangjiangensis]